MKKTDLLAYTNRDLSTRRKLATPARYESQTQDHRNFGYDYFDNPEAMGYGGYKYDGRYGSEVERVIDFFSLHTSPPAKILEIGCAKGFVLVEFLKLGLDVTGIDLSQYCVDNCHEDLSKP